MKTNTVRFLASAATFIFGAALFCASPAFAGDDRGRRDDRRSDQRYERRDDRRSDERRDRRDDRRYVRRDEPRDDRRYVRRDDGPRDHRYFRRADARFRDVPRFIGPRDVEFFRPYIASRFYYGPRRLEHVVYRFPVETPDGVVFRTFIYCGGALIDESPAFAAYVRPAILPPLPPPPPLGLTLVFHFPLR